DRDADLALRRNRDAGLASTRRRWLDRCAGVARAFAAFRRGQGASFQRSRHRRGTARQHPGRRHRRPAMTVHANQLSALADALAAVLPLGEPADIALHAFFRDRTRMGVRDRAFVAEAVFATLRRLRSLTRHAGTSAPRGLAIAAVLRELGVSLRELEPVLSEEELAWAKDFKARKPELSPAEAADLPDWLWNKLDAALPASE